MSKKLKAASALVSVLAFVVSASALGNTTRPAQQVGNPAVGTFDAKVITLQGCNLRGCY